MLSIDYIRKNKEKVLKAAKNKGYKVGGADLERLVKLDDEKRKVISEVQKINEEKNVISKGKATEELKEKGKKLKEELKRKEESLRKVGDELNKLLYQIPNLPLEKVPAGKGENQNKVVKKHKEPVKLDFKPKDHLELGELLDIMDVKRAAKVSGSRFGYLKNEGALLEFALINLALEFLIKESFVAVVPPVLIKKEITDLLGYWQGGGNEDYFQVEDFYLVGTAEHSLVPFYKDEAHNSFGKISTA